MTEIYATEEAFAAHLANDKRKGPLATALTPATRLPVNSGGIPNEGSKKLLADFGTTYHETATNAFVLNSRADRDSRV